LEILTGARGRYNSVTFSLIAQQRLTNFPEASMRSWHSTQKETGRKKLRAKRRKQILDVVFLMLKLALVTAAAVYLGVHYHD
jgi:hypothetical protein